MARPKKITGSRITQFPGATFNALVAGELQNRVPRSASDEAGQASRNSSTICGLAWDGAEALDPGSVVVLTEPMTSFEQDRSAPFSGIRFKCEAPATATLEDAFAITCVPISQPPTGRMSTGVGYVAGACWAQVTVNDEADETAELVDGETFLSSTESGRVPIIWKPTGTGVKWCVVQLAASGGGGGVDCGFAKIIGAMIEGEFEADEDVPAMEWVENEEEVLVLRVGVAMVVPMVQVVPDAPYAEQVYDWLPHAVVDPENEGFEGFEVDNMCGDDIASGKYIQWKTMQNGRKFIDAVACFDPEEPA